MTHPEENQALEIGWDSGTAYDLFASLYVLHNPAKFGLRGAWAAGVRSRLPAAERKFLEEAYESFFIPIHWIYSLPEPKDAATALWMLGNLPPEKRLPTLLQTPSHEHPELYKILDDVTQRRAWDENDHKALKEAFHALKEPLRPQVIDRLLEWFARPEAFGQRYLEALQTYQNVFFAEEERRIQPALQGSLERAQKMAENLSVNEMLEDLSRGVHFASLPDVSHLVLAPCYWTTPLLIYDKIEPGRMLVLFGARPADTALVPGEMIPEAMLQALKALADPTRLRILRYLAQDALTPSQLSRRLRLRAPTVTHHLTALRLAGLVHLTVDGEGERRYAVRPEALEDTFEMLQSFLSVREEAGERS